MSYKLFAAIDVGSHETALRIYEISKKNGVNELEYIHHTAKLGLETYSTGHISYQTMDNLCRILNGFSQKMKEYAIEDYMIVATSAIREADNNLIVLDQVKQRTGFQIKILSNSEQRFLYYKAIALKQNAFHKLIEKGTLIVDVGGGSIQLSLLDKNELITTQNVRLGSLRIEEILQNMKNKTDNYQNLVYEYIAHDLHTFKKLYLKDHKVKNIIALGNQLGDFVKYLGLHHFGNLLPVDAKGHKKDSISRQEYESFYRTIVTKSPERIAKELNVSFDRATLLLPIGMIFHNIFEETDAEQVWLSGIMICDGMAADFAERKVKIVPAHSFADGIVTASRYIAARFQCDEVHNGYIETAALKIFDAIKRQNNLNKHDRLLLQISAILQSCGSFINLNDVGENSYKIVSSTEIIGISHNERMMVATIIRYLVNEFPNYENLTDRFDREEYIRITKLNAILRLARSMDSSYRQKFDDITVNRRENTLIITGQTLYDITLEQGMFRIDAGFFEEVYGLTPVLKQKKQF